MSAVAAVRDVVGQLAQRVLLEPIRTGRLRPGGWPAGLAPVVLIGLAVYVIGLVGAVLAGVLRTRLPHDSVAGFPPALLPVMIIMIMVVVALVCTGALHAPWPLRLLGLLVALVVLIEASIWTLTWWSVLVQLGFWLLLVIFAVVRRRHTFVWWEYLVVQAVVGAAMTMATWQGIRVGLDRQYLDVTDIALLLLASLALFAVPTAMTAGVALSELAISTSVWLVETVSLRVRPSVAAGLTCLLAVVTVLVLAWRWWRSTLPVVAHLTASGVAAVVVLLTVAAWWLVDRVADRRGHASTRWHQLVPQTRRVGVAFALVITLPVTVAALALVLRLGLRLPAEALGVGAQLTSALDLPGVSSPLLRGAGSVGAGIGAIAVALVTAARWARGRAELIMIIGVLSVVRGGGELGWLALTPSLDDLSTVTVTVIIVATLVALARRVLSPRRIEAVAVALVIALAVSQRELLADPLGLVLGGTGGALLAFGLVWSLLTGAEEANGDSLRFPRPARALLVVANLAVVMTVFAFGQLTVGASLTLEGYVGEGSEVIGTGLLLAALWAVLGAAIRDEHVIETSPSRLPGSVLLGRSS